MAVASTRAVVGAASRAWSTHKGISSSRDASLARSHRRSLVLMSKIAERVQAQVEEVHSVRLQIHELLKPLQQWQRESVLVGLWFYSEYGPGRLRS